MKHFNRRTQLLQRNFFFALLAVGLFLALPALTFAAPGDLDPTFGNGGKVITNFNGRDYAYAAALQPDGKLIVAGTNNPTIDFLIVRYNGNGSLDTSFGDGGKVTTDFGAGDYAHAIAVQPDGKIVAAGLTQSSSIGNIVLARYNADGSLDSTFGNGGKVTTDINGQYERADALVLQADGKLVTAGYTCGGGRCSFALIRYNPNGSLDSTFGSGGIVITNFGGQGDGAGALVLQADGKIVAAGSASLAANSDFALARYNSNGTLDTTFGTGGKVTTDFGMFEGAGDVVIQPDGKIVAAGYYGDGDFDNDPFGFALARYNTDGTLDATFGSGGKVLTGFGRGLSGLALQADGKIVASGQNVQSGNNDFTLARYNTNGSLDTTFGTGGKVTTNFGDYSTAKDIVIQPDGKIVAVGYVGFDADLALARYLGDSVVARRTPFDFDGDGKADQAVFRPSERVWYLLQSQSGFTGVQFGASTDKITPADFDGDGKTDIAVYRDGTWYWLNSSNGNFNAIQFGASTDIPIPADFDGDGRAEIAVYRPSNGTWYIYNSANNQTTEVLFGSSEDKPVPADYDGDGKADVAVFRPSDGTWYLQRSQAGFTGIAFGTSEDKPVPADYDGDGKTDVAVFRPSSGTWYLQRSQLGLTGAAFGFGTDLPVPADYDGDGKADIAVFRDGIWYLQRSAAGLTGVSFGNPTDKPVPNAFVP